jgi:hypothetical protein
MNDIILKLRLLIVVFGLGTVVSAYSILNMGAQFASLKDRIVDFGFVILGSISILVHENHSPDFLHSLPWVPLTIFCITGMLSCLFKQNILTAVITVTTTLVWFVYGLGFYFRGV